MTAWLVDTLVASSALMALVLLLREPVRTRFGPAVAYSLWLIPAVRMVLPPISRTVERTVTAAPANGTPVTMTAASPSGIAVATPFDWTAILIAIWLAGAVVILACSLSRYIAQRKSILDSAIPLARIGSIRLIRSERVRGPMAFGIFDQVIIVPFDFDDRFTESQRRLALDHELSHHRSGDLVANLIAFVLLCLQWFNPLAWAAHAAFRFDQEAACDARVLDKVVGRDRVSYGQAIAKAATGRTLLFAGALDRPSTLSRRLTIMTSETNPELRRLGFALLGGTALLVLPLTATWAINYVDKVGTAVPAAVPAHLAAPVTTTAALAQAAAAAAPSPGPAIVAAEATSPRENPDGTVTISGGVVMGKGDVAFFSDDRIVMNGKVKRVEDMTAAERARLRDVIAKSRRDIEREKADLPNRLAEAKREIERIKSGAMEREIQRDLKDLRDDLARVDSEAAELRSSGLDPEKVKAQLRQALSQAETEAVSSVQEAREELAELDPEKLIAELRNDEAQMARLQARLDQLDRR